MLSPCHRDLCCQLPVAPKTRPFCDFRVSCKFDNGTSAPFGYHQGPILFVVLIFHNVFVQPVPKYGTDKETSACRSHLYSRAKVQTTLGAAGDAEEDTNRSGYLTNLANSVCSELNSATRASQIWGQRTHCGTLSGRGSYPRISARQKWVRIAGCPSVCAGS